MLISKGAGAINLQIVPEPVFPYYKAYSNFKAVNLTFLLSFYQFSIKELSNEYLIVEILDYSVLSCYTRYS